MDNSSPYSPIAGFERLCVFVVFTPWNGWEQCDEEAMLNDHYCLDHREIMDHGYRELEL